MLIHGCLEELLEKDLKYFTFCLRESKLNGFAPIPCSHLEDKDRIGIADLMINHYGGEALQVTLKIWKQMRRIDLAQHLESVLGKKNNSVSQAVDLISTIINPIR